MRTLTAGRGLLMTVALASVLGTAQAGQPSYVWPDYSVHRTAYKEPPLDRRSLGSNRMRSDTPRMATASKKPSKKVAAVASAPVAVAAVAKPTPAPEVVAVRNALPALPPPQMLTAEQKWQLYSYP